MKRILTVLNLLVLSFVLDSCQQPTEIRPHPTPAPQRILPPTDASQDTPSIIDRESPDLTDDEKVFFKNHPEATILHRYMYGTRIYFSAARLLPMPRELSVLFRTGTICRQNKSDRASAKGIGGGVLIGGCMTLDEYAQQIEAQFENEGYGDVLVNIYLSPDNTTLIIYVYNAQLGQTPGGLIATIITALLN